MSGERGCAFRNSAVEQFVGAEGEDTGEKGNEVVDHPIGNQ